MTDPEPKPTRVLKRGDHPRISTTRTRWGWLGWACAIPPVGLAVARITRLEGRSIVIAAEAVTPLFLLPACAALGLGLFSRQRALSVVAGALIALQLTWVLPELRPARPLPAAAGDAPHVRIFSSNLKFTNTRMVGIAAEIRKAKPDVVALQELSPTNLEALQRTGVLDEFEFKLIQPQLTPTGTGVFSHLPMTDAGAWDLYGMLNARVTLTVGDRKVRLYDVHMSAPFGPTGATRWEKQLSAIRHAAEAETLPVVVAGDFNATYGHRRFRDLIDSGLRDAHAERGRGWATTWPRDRPIVPAVVRLDHVLVSRRIAVLGIVEGKGQGSDHRPLIADLAVVG